MNQLIIIKTTDTKKIKNVLVKNHIEHQIVYTETLTDKKDKLRKRSLGGFNKLLKYIEMKSKENIFSDYGEALKDKGLEVEKELLENDLD